MKHVELGKDRIAKQSRAASLHVGSFASREASPHAGTSGSRTLRASGGNQPPEAHPLRGHVDDGWGDHREQSSLWSPHPMTHLPTSRNEMEEGVSR